MKKTFSIDLKDSITENVADSIQYVLRQWHLNKEIEVKEIKPPNFCYAPMSVEKKYCECAHHRCLVNKECEYFGHSHDKPKPPIEIKKLTDYGEGKPIKGYNLKRTELDIIDITKKTNQIINWIETHNKEA